MQLEKAPRLRTKGRWEACALPCLVVQMKEQKNQLEVLDAAVTEREPAEVDAGGCDGRV